MTLNGVIAAAVEVEKFCRDQKWRYCIIGGIAVQRWGKPRFTQDVDLTLLTDLGSEEAFIDALLNRFIGRTTNARRFAIENRVLLLRTSSGVDLDFCLGAFPYEEACVGRASPWKGANRISLTTCSAEDLVIHKVFSGRDRDWGDVDSILSRQFPQFELELVRRELPPLLDLKGDSESLMRFNRLVETVKAKLQPGPNE